MKSSLMYTNTYMYSHGNDCYDIHKELWLFYMKYD